MITYKELTDFLLRFQTKNMIRKAKIKKIIKQNENKRTITK